MRALLLSAVFLSACAQQPPRTASEYLALYQPTFVSPAPQTIVKSVGLTLAPGDRVLSNCASFFADEMGELSPEDLRDFDATVTCVYPARGAMDASFAHYALEMAAKGFEPNSGTYVQSGMSIFCNRTHTIVFALRGKHVPRSFIDAQGNEIDLPGGGSFGHETWMLSAAEQPCERYEMASGYSEPPAPDGYAARAQPDFIAADQAHIRWGNYELPLRPGDRLVSHCAQYYREEIGGNLPKDAIPEEFARYNQTFRCIYPGDGNLRAAAAHYMSVLDAAGYNRPTQLGAPRPDAGDRFPSLVAGMQEWSGVISRCGSDQKSVLVGAMARYGGMTMADPLTGEYFAKRDPSGGRARKLEGASFPHPILTIRLGSFGC
jgi:hypothetical protein